MCVLACPVVDLVDENRKHVRFRERRVVPLGSPRAEKRGKINKKSLLLCLS
jgi:hypothetical protein